MLPPVVSGANILTCGLTRMRAERRARKLRIITQKLKGFVQVGLDALRVVVVDGNSLEALVAEALGSVAGLADVEDSRDFFGTHELLCT